LNAERKILHRAPEIGEEFEGDLLTWRRAGRVLISWGLKDAAPQAINPTNP
jgi:hypothetical protein